LAESVDLKFVVECVKRCSEALERLAAENGREGHSPTISAILVDLFLPDCRGIETFNRIWHAAPRIPILVLTSASEEGVAKLAVHRGAQDYLLLSRVDTYLLPKFIGNMIDGSLNAEALVDEKERARALALQTSYLAQHDSLTGLPNRILLQDRLDQALAAAQRRRTRLAVLFLDIDRFKNVNDSLGHAVGDRLLQSVALRLQGCVRASDTVSRQGGDEFVILLSEVGAAHDAAVCADKIQSVFAEPHHVAETALYVTFSIGIVMYPEDGADAATLLQNAEFAMYQAKSHGRNCHQFFAPGMNVAALERQSLENALRLAIEREEFVLHFQPKRDLATGAIVALEGLIRWNDPARGMLPPAQFMAVAEDSGLIVPIGRWVLREACRQGTAWRDAGHVPLRVAVNVSAVELRSKDFVAGVRTILRETGFDPACLEIELTETYLMTDSQSTETVLDALKEMGVSIALDDFGTGYSSLSYMRRFPVDSLKIDESFVRNLTSDSANAGIVSAVISMGKSLHMRVVAEGVETAMQLAFLQEHGCPEGQGYFLGRPAAAAEIGLLLSGDAASAAAVAWDHGGQRPG